MTQPKRGKEKKAEKATEESTFDALQKDFEDLWQNFFRDQIHAFTALTQKVEHATFFNKGNQSDVKDRWSTIIRQELARCFQITPVGPLRQYQEKTARFLQALTEWEAACTAFSILMNRPLEEAFAGIEERIRTEEKDVPDENLFPLWIKLLEARYMDLYRSDEFMANLHKTLQAVTSVSKAREGLMEDVLKSSHIPTPRDMDDLYQELYLLRKRLEKLETTLKERHGRL
ncbi:MAG: hypothetical protein JW902_19130 [Syntrophaceae bacterium]|nr:hypothetical protein [Syntrophaceae bacterium]